MKRVLLLAAAAVAVWGCGSGRDDPEGLQLGPAFLTPVAVAQEAGLQVYWVGERFEVDGYSFYPWSARFASNEDPLYVRIEYGADVEGGGSIGFEVTIYSAEGWDGAKERVLPRAAGVARKDVIVRGWPAELFSIPVGRWTNQLVIVDAPDSIIVTTGNASISNSRQVNPLNDPERLLAVLEDLRPYPE